MAKNELSKRDRWQDESGPKAAAAEKRFFDVMTELFAGSELRIRPKPKDFKNIYNGVELSEETLEAIYNPDESWVHGVQLDYAIDNVKTKKTIYVEVKRQDGWVEGKPRSAGRGNAHERSCKFFTPGLLSAMRAKGNIPKTALPFWTVFQGDIARDPKRVREITFWYADQSDHFFLWHDSTKAEPLADHFNSKLKHLLD